MRPIATEGVAWSVGLPLCNDCEPFKNGWTDRDAVWDVDSGGPRNYGCPEWSTHGKWHFEGNDLRIFPHASEHRFPWPLMSGFPPQAVDQRFPLAVPRSNWVSYYVFPMKNPLCDAAFRQNSVTICYYYYRALSDVVSLIWAVCCVCIYVCQLIMAALCNRAGHYILPCSFFLLSSSIFFFFLA